MSERIPAGYKRTEIGTIPQDWEVRKLGEVADLYQPETISQTEFKSTGRYLVYGANGVIGRYDRYNHETWQVIVACRGSTVGAVNKTEDRVWINGNAMVINVDHGRAIDKQFLYYLLKIQDFSELVSGSGQPQITRGPLGNLLIPLPPTLEEQRAIARIISDFDALVESLGTLIAKKRAVRSGVMKVLLTGSKRLPGFGGEWKVKKIGDIAQVRKGDPITEKEARKGNVPVIGGGMGPTYYHDRPNRGPNTITISASGANAGYVDFHRRPIFASDCSTIEEGEGYDVRFLYYSLKSKQEVLSRLQTGGAQSHVYPNKIKGLEIHVPPTLEEQRAVARVLSDMDAETEALERKKKKYEIMMKGAMKLLLTGRMRVPVA